MIMIKVIKWINDPPTVHVHALYLYTVVMASVNRHLSRFTEFALIHAGHVLIRLPFLS